MNTKDGIYKLHFLINVFRDSAQGLCCEVFGKGGPQIWLDNVDCQGTEPDIFHCQHVGWGNHNCDNHAQALHVHVTYEQAWWLAPTRLYLDQ